MKRKIDWNGHPKIPPLTSRQRRLRQVIRFVQTYFPAAYITSTHDLTHASRSLHGQWSRLPINWRAVDFGSDRVVVKRRVHNAIFEQFGARTFTELFGPINAKAVVNGNRTTLIEGSALETAHDTHVHVGI